MIGRRAPRRVTPRATHALLAALLAVALPSCGGSSPTTPTPPTPPPTTMTFSGSGAPAVDSVALTLQGATSNQVTLALVVNNVNDLYGAGVDLTFDPAVVAFSSFEAGTLLNGDGAAVNTQVSEPQSGTLVIGVTRVGAVPGITGSGTLIVLRFNAVTPGSTAVATGNGGAFDSAGTALATQFFGGTLTVPGG